MITIYSPRIHNLGDFIHVFPTLSGFYKKYGKFSFGICPRLKRFNGLVDFLMYQGMFTEVFFFGDRPLETQYIVVDDTGDTEGNCGEAYIQTKYYNFFKQNYPNLPFDFDYEFELKAKPIDTSEYDDKYIVGDRWAHNAAPDVDDRRPSNIIESYDKFKSDKFVYLDYSNDMMDNLSLVKYSKNKFITTITGIGIIADLMNKETVILWDEDMRTWQGDSFDYVFRNHHWSSRNTKLHYIRNYKV